MRLDLVHSVADARGAARRVLPAALFDYADGAADDETTMRANEAAFEDFVFRPHVGSELLSPDISVTVLGTGLRLPVMLDPCGLVRLIHPSGGAGVARAAATRGTISALSSLAGSSVEEVAPEAPGRVWFQLYSAGKRSTAVELIDRAGAAGVDVLVVTMDCAAYGNRERDLHHRVSFPLRIGARSAVRLGSQVIARPSWAWRMAPDCRQLLQLITQAKVGGLGEDIVAASPFTWEDISFLRERWPGRLVVKGVLTAEDAREAVARGVDGVVVSNHGGRQLDGAPATLRALPEVVDAVGDSAEVLLDGGVRRGTHVVKALALGARAVLVGRPYLWGLAVGGQAGVEHVLDLLHQEMVRTMILLGCPSVSELGPHWLRRNF